MKFTRRNALGLMAAAPLARGLRADAPAGLEIAKGPFAATRASLAGYRVPEWFRDAKFGIWAHWGPQSAAEDGDWYARNMYIQGSPQYKYHLEHYGHPSKFGFKDVIPTWKGDQFDPDHLVEIYKKAGAKYFVSMGVHHDNFDLWNSKHTRWNAVNMGPKKDIVGLFRQAALKHGLKFGVSDHLWISYKWWAVSHASDTEGLLTGVPYDGTDPQNADLYHEAACARFAGPDFGWNDDGIPDSWKRHWFDRIKDLIDNYEPDLLYTDGLLPFEDYGLSQVANLYNRSAARNGGVAQAIYTSKRPEDCETGTCLLDMERGVADGIMPNPWQTDTCVGEWHYKRGAKYKTPKTVIDLLVDIVSRNGNLLLNFPLPNSGAPDAEELKIVAAITDWMAVNSEGIYGTRPWKIFGVGPGTQVVKKGPFNESARKDLTADDVRFTTKGSALYAFLMGWPAGSALIQPLGTASPQAPGKIANVELLGYKGELEWSQTEAGLRVTLPHEAPSQHAVTLKVALG
ncbi:MAG: alpha-L-fucosidase [Bryobacteraceae bacterium]